MPSLIFSDILWEKLNVQKIPCVSIFLANASAKLGIISIPDWLLSNYMILKVNLLAVLSLSHVRLFETLWPAARQTSLPFTISQSLLKLISIESVMPSNHLILCHLLLQSLLASRSFLMGQFFTSGGQNIGASASASASVPPMNIQDLFPLGLTSLIREDIIIWMQSSKE